ncbi:unnamed protein product [Chrysodeixis includens]|uniref:Uncharacterized protein n=1 Tax=Chrysodeixis includens TaxID=689277 RepID=A0A9P0FPD0_CHRIL|nr:unnamed protein product [Chrysodeixis includens]
MAISRLSIVKFLELASTGRPRQLSMTSGPVAIVASHDVTRTYMRDDVTFATHQALTCSCVALHYKSYNTDADTGMLVTGTFVGYLIIFAGAAAGYIMQTPSHKRIDIFYSLVGVALFIASGALIIDRYQHGYKSDFRDMNLAKASLSIINGAVLLIDAVLTQRGVVWSEGSEYVDEFLMTFPGSVALKPLVDNYGEEIRNFNGTGFEQTIFFASSIRKYEIFMEIINEFIRYPILFILVIELSIEEPAELTKYIKITWENDQGDVVIISADNAGNVTLSTFFPYSDETCKNYKPVTLSPNNNLFPNKFNNFYQCPIRVTVMQMLPKSYLIRSDENITSLGGYDGSIFMIILDKMNATLDVTSVDNHKAYGTYVNGSFVGSISELVHETADILVPSGILTHRRYLVAFASHIYHTIDIRWIGPKRREVYNWIKVLIPDSTHVSPFQAIVCAAFVVMAVIIQRLKRHLTHTNSGVLLQVYLIFLGQPTKFETKSTLLNSFLALWIWCCFVVRIEYQGDLFKSMQTLSLEEPFTSVDEAITQVDSFGGMEVFQDFYRDIHSAQNYKTIPLLDNIKYIQRVFEGERFLMVTDMVSVPQSILNQIQVLKDHKSTANTCYYMRPGWPAAKTVDNIILSLVEGGFIEFILSKTDREWKIPIFKHEEVTPKGLSLSTLGTCFQGLMVMWGYYQHHFATTVVWSENESQYVDEYLRNFPGCVVLKPLRNNQDNDTIDEFNEVFGFRQTIFFASNINDYENFMKVINDILRYPIRLILVIEDTVEGSAELTKYNKVTWDNDQGDVVVISADSSNEVTLSTFYPYSYGICRNYEPVTLEQDENLFPNKFINFHRCSVRAIVMQLFPYAQVVRENGIIVAVDGHDGFIFMMILNKLNATLRVTGVDDVLAYGRAVNRTVSSSMTDLATDKADILIPSLILNLKRYSTAFASHVYHTIDIRWIGPPRRNVFSWLKVLVPDKSHVSPMHGLICILFVIVVTFIQKLKKHLTRPHTQVLSQSFLIFLGQPTKFESRSSLLNYIFALWIWGCFIVRIEYQGDLFESMQRTSLEEPLGSVDEAVAKVDNFGGIELFHDLYKDSHLAKNYKTIPLTANSKYIQRILEGERFLLVTDMGSVPQTVNNKIQILNDRRSTANTCYFMRPGWPAAKNVDHIILSLVEGGFIDYLLRKHEHEWNIKLSYSEDLKPKALTISILGTCFWGLSIKLEHIHSKITFPKGSQSLFIQRKDDSNIIIDIISEVEVEIGKQTGQVPTPFANEMQT